MSKDNIDKNKVFKEKEKTFTLKKSIPLALALSAIGALSWFSNPVVAGLGDYDLSQTPLYVGNPEPPIMMMVMSRDEQLFKKAYNDYTDLDEDGVIDTTYNDNFDYSGYFDPNLCYNYTNSTFIVGNRAGGTNNHSCSGNWSGNFLNWVSMSRLDVVRYVLYGGKRQLDTATTTVLERSYIPNDLHSWVKIYEKSDISSFTPYTSTTSFCNTSLSETGIPLMRVASGRFSEWASTSETQCLTKSTAIQAARNDVPDRTTDFTVRVNVCSGATEELRESNCRNYSDGTTSTYKPAGLLQEYGEAGKIKFGLITGSYSSPRGGGVLRRNIGLFAGNSTTQVCSDKDEVNLNTGQFCAKIGNAEGIIRTLDALKINGWNGKTWNDCSTYAILNRHNQSNANGHLKNPGSNNGYNCSAWGNPISEMYAEALRYISGATTPTSGFVASNDLAGLPTNVAWLDPYRSIATGGSSYCASCSVLVLSSGLPSFDSDEIPTVSGITEATSATNAVGTHEGITSKNYFAGRITATPKGTALDTHTDTCKTFTITSFGLVRGLCPDSPSTEGSFLMSGLAHQAAIKNLRPALTTGTTAKVNVKTYGIQLAENLPTFKIPLGDSSVSLSPLCQSHNNGSANSGTAGWRTCHLGAVDIGQTRSAVSPNHVYGRNLKYNGSRVVAGSYKLTWEDSLWGNDHDNDAVSVLTFCVGSNCNDKTNPANTTNTTDICYRSTSTVCTANNAKGRPVIAEDEVLVRYEVISAYAGNALLTGLTVTGSDANGTYRDYLRPGGRDGSLISTTGNPDQQGSNPSYWSKPIVRKFRLGPNDTGVLQTPLWYAAKYGNFKDGNNNNLPDPGEWDTVEAGKPDGYFLAHNPMELKERLSQIFKDAAGGNATVSGSGSGARINSSSFSVYATYTVDSDNNWTGDLVAESINRDGSAGSVLWRASERMNNIEASSRNIIMVKKSTSLNDNGSISNAVETADFSSSNLPGSTTAEKLSSLGIDTIPEWYQNINSVNALVNYLRGQQTSSLRYRSNKLGDIVNSAPSIVLGADDYGYKSWRSNEDNELDQLGESYATYLTNKESRTPMVYIGANDGMLHGFNAANNTTGGNEVFAFIPESSRLHMAELANPEYIHKYFVDGMLTSGDIYKDGWKTILIGSTGAGGYSSTEWSTRIPGGSVFALDVSNPDGFSASNVLWELSSNNDIDLGYLLGSAKIVPVKIGNQVRFVALFGNGVNSNNGAPVLFVVDAHTGELIKKIKPEGSFTRNGLINVAPISRLNRNGLADIVYGGDMQGNVWKYNLSSSNPSEWSIEFDGEPLFTAENKDGERQSITGEFEVVSGPTGGQMVYFGTGRYISGTDISDPNVNSLYGILDNNSSKISSRESLVEQTITTTAISSRQLSSNPVSYTSSRGWFIDLAVSGVKAGEKFIGTPTAQSGNVYFVTYVPTQSGCAGTVGINWLYGLSAISGAPVLNQASTSGDDSSGNQVCGADCGAISLTNISGSVSPAPIKTSDVFIPSMSEKCDDGSCSREELLAANQCSFVLSIAGASDIFLPRACGRQSWRKVQ